MSRPVAIYHDVFDPINNVHIEIIKSICEMFSDVYIGIDDSKNALFSQKERCELVNKVLANECIQAEGSITVASMRGKVTEFINAYSIDNPVLVKTLTFDTNIPNEFVDNSQCQLISPCLKIVYLPVYPDICHITHDFVIELADNWQIEELKSVVPSCCIAAFKEKASYDLKQQSTTNELSLTFENFIDPYIESDVAPAGELYIRSLLKTVDADKIIKRIIDIYHEAEDSKNNIVKACILHCLSHFEMKTFYDDDVLLVKYILAEENDILVLDYAVKCVENWEASCMADSLKQLYIRLKSVDGSPYLLEYINDVIDELKC